MTNDNETAFEYNVRVLLCTQCGAAISMPREGNLLKCEFCGTEAILEKKEIEKIDDKELGPELSESELTELHKEQVNNKTPEQNKYVLTWPSELEPTKQMAPAIAHEAFEAAFKKERSNPVSDPHLHNMRLTVMACVLSNRYLFLKESLSARAVLETALEEVKDDGFKQVLLTRIVRTAVFADDIQGAARWLNECNPSSPILSIHCEYLTAKAFVAVGEKKWQGILDTVGATVGEIPIEKENAPLMGALRVHAYDEMGEIALAKKELNALKARYGIRKVFGAISGMSRYGIAEKSFKRSIKSARINLLISVMIVAGIIAGIVFAVI